MKMTTLIIILKTRETTVSHIVLELPPFFIKKF